MLNLKQKKFLIFGFLIILIAGCGQPLPLKNASEEVVTMAKGMFDYCLGENHQSEDISDKINEIKTLMDEIYQGEMTPQTDDSRLKIIDNGLQLPAYPEQYETAGAIVGVPLDVTLQQFIESLVRDDWATILTDPQRYVMYQREYTEGDKDKFVAGEEDYLFTTNLQEDTGQRGIRFKYTTNLRFIRHRSETFPDEGVLVVCNWMTEPAENTTGELNAYMDYLYSWNIYYPKDANSIYKINSTMLKAGGGLWIFMSGANSGNVGEGIIDETTSFVNFIKSEYY